MEVLFKMLNLFMKNIITDSINPKAKINRLRIFSPQIFLIPSEERSKNKEVFKNIPDIHTPSYKESK